MVCHLGVLAYLDVPLAMGSVGSFLSKATLLRLPESVNKQTNQQISLPLRHDGCEWRRKLPVRNRRTRSSLVPDQWGKAGIYRGRTYLLLSSGRGGPLLFCYTG